MSGLNCTARMDGHRCQRLRLHRGYHQQKQGVTTRTWGRDACKRETYETAAPWVTWLWLSTDRETRVTGRSRMRLTCAVCGRRETVRIRIPRWGTVPPPPGGIHAARRDAIERHAHPDRGHPMSWKLPLLNPAAHRGGIDIDLLTMRLAADSGSPEEPQQ